MSLTNDCITKTPINSCDKSKVHDKYVDSIISIFHHVDICDCCDPTLYDKETMNELWKKYITADKYDILHIRKRKLPQLDYNYQSMFTSDILFRFEDKIHLLCANIVCCPYISGKWHRGIEDIFPFLLVIDINYESLTGLCKDSSSLDKFICAIVPETKFELQQSSYDEISSSQDSEMNEVPYKKRVSNGILVGIENEYHCDSDDGDEGYEILRYYGDPKKLTSLTPLMKDYNYEIIELRDTYIKWLCNELSRFPENEIDRLCYLMLIYQNPTINSGK